MTSTNVVDVMGVDDVLAVVCARCTSHADSESLLCTCHALCDDRSDDFFLLVATMQLSWRSGELMAAASLV